MGVRMMYLISTFSCKKKVFFIKFAVDIYANNNFNLIRFTMKTNYQSPTVDILMIDIEDAILSNSPAGSLENLESGGTIGDF